MPIRVTIEIVPYGDESQVRVLDKFDITNVRTENNIANYAITRGKGKEMELIGIVKKFDRGQGFLRLVERAVANVGAANTMSVLQARKAKRGLPGQVQEPNSMQEVQKQRDQGLEEAQSEKGEGG